MIKLLIASNNADKINEIKNILAGTNIDVHSPSELKLNLKVAESGKTFEENAVIKARNAGQKSGFFTLADDSGIEVDALGGRPGIYSARYAQGNRNIGIQKLLMEMKNLPKEKRTARYIAVIAIYNPLNKKTVKFVGKCEGCITDQPIGNNGFGYDPIFYSNDLGKTFGQASDEEKNKVSHRALALQKLKLFLSKTQVSHLSHSERT